MTRTDRIQIEYTLVFDAPFHFGTGISAGMIDRTVIHDNNGYLYVPASTFKGVMREHCEQLCRFYLPDSLIASPHDAEAALADLSGTLTPVNRVFGSQISPGQLRFYDAVQTEAEQRIYEGQEADGQQKQGKYTSIQTSISTQVRIDRLTRIAADKALYISEFGIRGLFFEGHIDGWLACTPVETLTVEEPGETSFSGTPTYSLLLLLAGLQLVERLGGNKSTGKGHCTCTITRLAINKQVCSQEHWQLWLEHLDELVHYI